MLRTLSLLALLALIPFGTAAAQPASDPFGLGVERLKVKLSAKSEAKNKLLVDTDLNLAEGLVDPHEDTLMLFVGGILDYDFEPSELKQTGPNRWKFKDKFAIRSGWVQLYQQGSSRGRLKLTDKGFLADGVGGLGDLEAIDVRLVWGGLDTEVTVAPKVNGKGKRADFKAGKQTYASLELWVDDARVKRHGGKDSLDLRARVTDGDSGAFDPLASQTTIGFGPFSIFIPADEWSTKAQGTKLSWVSEDKTVKVTYDSVREELRLRAKQQDLSRQTTEASCRVFCGDFEESRTVVLSVNAAETSFRY